MAEPRPGRLEKALADEPSSLTPDQLRARELWRARWNLPILLAAIVPLFVTSYLDTWRTREWYPALEAASVDQRGPYCMRHTFATEALAAGVSIFELARLMGTSVAMIDQRYGHLARDSEASIRAPFGARNIRLGVDQASSADSLSGD